MKLRLKILDPSDVGQSYVDWFADEDVVRYSENQYLEFSLLGQINYVQRCRSDKDVELFGIFDGGQHIGNIVVKGLCSPHRRAEIGFVVGEKEYWGRGVGRFAVAEIVRRARNVYGLKKLYATVAAPNIGSQKVLEHNGFRVEGRKMQHLYYMDAFYDQLDYGLLLEEVNL